VGGLALWVVAWFVALAAGDGAPPRLYNDSGDAWWGGLAAWVVAWSVALAAGDGAPPRLYNDSGDAWWGGRVVCGG